MVGLLSSTQRSVKLTTLGLVNQRLERCCSTSLSLEGGVVDGGSFFVSVHFYFFPDLKYYLIVVDLKYGGNGW